MTGNNKFGESLFIKKGAESRPSTFFMHYLKDLSKAKVLVPPLDKRNIIAKKLDSFDLQISLVEKMILELKQQKKSMQQLLLTGILMKN